MGESCSRNQWQLQLRNTYRNTIVQEHETAAPHVISIRGWQHISKSRTSLQLHGNRHWGWLQRRDKVVLQLCRSRDRELQSCTGIGNCCSEDREPEPGSYFSVDYPENQAGPPEKRPMTNVGIAGS